MKDKHVRSSYMDHNMKIQDIQLIIYSHINSHKPIRKSYPSKLSLYYNDANASVFVRFASPNHDPPNTNLARPQCNANAISVLSDGSQIRQTKPIKCNPHCTIDEWTNQNTHPQYSIKSNQKTQKENLKSHFRSNNQRETWGKEELWAHTEPSWPTIAAAASCWPCPSISHIKCSSTYVCHDIFPLPSVSSSLLLLLLRL